MNLYRNNLTIGDIPQLDVVVPSFFPRDGLVAYYKLDGNSNDSVGSNNGTPYNISYVDGKYNKAVSCNGSSSYITFGNLGITGSNARSFSAWFKLGATSMSAWTSMIGWVGASTNSTYFDIEIGASNNLVLHFYGTEIAIDTLSNLGTSSFYNIIATYDGTTAKVYLNNVLKSSVNISLATNSNFNIGRRASTGNYFNGLIDEVAVYSKELSSDERNKIYNGGAGSFYN